jgi:hypothetical protein
MPSIARVNLEPMTGNQGRSIASEEAVAGNKPAITTPRESRPESKENRLADSEDRKAKLMAPVTSGSKMRNAEIIGFLYR